VETPAPQERFDLGARTPQQLEVFMLSFFFLHGATCTVLKQSILLGYSKGWAHEVLNKIFMNNKGIPYAITHEISIIMHIIGSRPLITVSTANASVLSLERGTLYPQDVIPMCLGPIGPSNTSKVSQQGLTTKPLQRVILCVLDMVMP